jgi:hypothetical protein
MTRLPASEDAFLFGQKEDAPFLDEVFTGACHSAFATTLVICHIFKITLNHTSRHSYGAAFWKRHKDLDHKISSIFMFLPERFQLPDYKSNPVAAHTNLNLHATTICLHYAAVEMVDKHSHPEGTKRQSLGRMRISAEEIVEIIKTISPNSFIYVCSLSPPKWPATNVAIRNPCYALCHYTAQQASTFILPGIVRPKDCLQVSWLILR